MPVHMCGSYSNHRNGAGQCIMMQPLLGYPNWNWFVETTIIVSVSYTGCFDTCMLFFKFFFCVCVCLFRGFGVSVNVEKLQVQNVVSVVAISDTKGKH